MVDTKKGFIRYKHLSKFKEILHFTTTKDFSSGKPVKFTGDSQKIYLECRNKLAGELRINSNQLIFPCQTHSDRIANIQQLPDKEPQDVDAMVTNQRGICLCIQTADCVPILLFDPKKKVIAAVHAGWRGTVNRIVAKTVSRMVDEFDCSVSNIIVCIGPSIGPGVYEVGPKVVCLVEKNIPSYKSVLTKSITGKAMLNLWEANKNLLLSAGLNKKNISISGLCSYTDNQLFFSARRDSIQTGRIVTGIMLRE